MQKIYAGQYETDPLIDDPTDTRRGLTLLIRPDEIIRSRIRHFLDQLALVAPGQYFYPASDMHVTVMAVISAVPGFTVDQIDPKAYEALVQRSLAGIQPFQLDFRGLTASPAGVLVQGFPGGAALNDIRDQLRANFKTSTLPQSLDARYPIQTAHLTIARLRQPLADVPTYLEMIEKYRSVHFGTMQAHQLELVYNDWYQRAAHTQKLAQFALGSQKTM
ncbi:2'-5' RNA ligase family protein [Chitinophaga parva]|uniref:2'-5' RNA ligase family protein n=1 Tax=Chitinophaga parva TaxID=2169414 RepID=UPI00196A9170|nr:2'-5' RNA ligase family protein [Chitinophaga parva]